MNFSQIFDISLPITPDLTVYPGNPPVTITTQSSKSSYISKLTMGSHTGTHIDAPRHTNPEGLGIDQLSLSDLIGPCRVLDMTHAQTKVTVSDLKTHHILPGDRILLKTNNSLRGWDHFYPDYIYLDGDSADYLVAQKISLIGIDYFSIKQKGSQDLRPHTSLLDQNIPIIEAIDLSQIQAGDYFLIALPLALTGLDGSPARVILAK